MAWLFIGDTTISWNGHSFVTLMLESLSGLLFLLRCSMSCSLCSFHVFRMVKLFTVRRGTITMKYLHWFCHDCRLAKCTQHRTATSRRALLYYLDISTHATWKTTCFFKNLFFKYHTKFWSYYGQKPKTTNIQTCFIVIRKMTFTAFKWYIAWTNWHSLFQNQTLKLCYGWVILILKRYAYNLVSKIIRL